MIREINKTLRKISDAIVSDNPNEAKDAIEEYAKLRAVKFMEWADATPTSSIKVDWDNTSDLYNVYFETKDENS